GGERRQLVGQRPGAQLEVEPCRQRAAREDEPPRLALRRLDAACVETRAVGTGGAAADRDGVDLGPQLVHEPPALLAAHPALAGNGEAPVERRCRLVDHERPPLAHPRQPRLVQPARLVGVDQLDVDARLGEPLRPARRLGVRVAGAVHDALDPGGEDRVRARGRRPVVRARLQRHVQRRAPGPLARSLQRDDFAVAPACLGRALAGDLAVRDDDRTDGRLRVGAAAGGARELDRPGERHATASARPRYACAGSSAPKIDDAATKSDAPQSRSCAMLPGPTPPSTWIGVAGGSPARSRRIRSYASSMNLCPEYPGWIDMQRTRSTSPATAATSSGSVSGLNASPACRPCARAAAAVRATSCATSWWNVTLSAPAAANAPKWSVGRSTIRC